MDHSSLVLERQNLIKELRSSFKWKIMKRDRTVKKIKSLPDPFLRIEQEQWMELFKEKKNQLQNIVMQIDAWRSRYPGRVALVMASEPYQYLIDNGISPPPTPAFEEAECHKDAAKMMRLWQSEIKSMAASQRKICGKKHVEATDSTESSFTITIRDQVKERIKEVKNSELYKDYCAYVKHLTPKPKVKMNQKKIKNEEMLDYRINKWQEELRAIMCSQMDLPKPVGPSKV